MILKDLLQDNIPVELIEARTNSPLNDEDDILFGYCSWIDNKLESLDGDNYYLNEEVYKYEWIDDRLIYWFRSVWSKDYNMEEI